MRLTRTNINSSWSKRRLCLAMLHVIQPASTEAGDMIITQAVEHLTSSLHTRASRIRHKLCS